MWANLLHFYQPHGQKREIIDTIVEQCYRPVGEGILTNPRVRLTINFSGGLLDQLAEYGHQDVIDLYAEAARRGQVEFVGSAKYHTILPILAPAEARRQVEINNEANRRYLGDAYKPRGFFLPEMAWSPELAPMLIQAGFEWVMLDELAYDGKVGDVDYTRTYRVAGTKLKAVFREHALSTTLTSGVVRDVSRVKQAAARQLSPDRYIITAMDGEVYGHHWTGYDQLLIGLLADPDVHSARVSDVFEHFTDMREVATVAGTWASSEDDIAKGIQFISWDDPENEIHRKQWELLRLAVEQLDKLPVSNPAYPELRVQLDMAVASDQFYWAAARPWWMIEHIERGAHMLLEILQQVPLISPKLVERGQTLYNEIMVTAWDWQRSGKIDDMTGEIVKQRQRQKARIPFKETTLERGDKATWEAFRALLKQEERTAAKRGDYEAALLWRDGWYKLEHKLDIYDALFVVNLYGGPVYIIDRLKEVLPAGALEAALAHYQTRYDRIRGGQVEQRSN